MSWRLILDSIGVGLKWGLKSAAAVSVGDEIKFHPRLMSLRLTKATGIEKKAFLLSWLRLSNAVGLRIKAQQCFDFSLDEYKKPSIVDIGEFSL